MDSSNMMDVIFSVLALFFLFFLNSRKRAKKREGVKPAVEKVTDLPRQEQSLHYDYKAPRPVSPPQRPPESREPSKLVTTLNAPVYEVNRQTEYSRGHDLIDALSSRRNMFIYKEIFDKPMSMRNPADEHL